MSWHKKCVLIIFFVYFAENFPIFKMKSDKIETHNIQHHEWALMLIYMRLYEYTESENKRHEIVCLFVYIWLHFSLAMFAFLFVCLLNVYLFYFAHFKLDFFFFHVFIFNSFQSFALSFLTSSSSFFTSNYFSIYWFFYILQHI